MPQENPLPSYQQLLEHKDGVFQGLAVAFAIVIEIGLEQITTNQNLPKSLLAVVLGFVFAKLVEFFITRMRTSYLSTGDLDRSFRLVKRKYSKLGKHIDEQIQRLQKELNSIEEGPEQEALRDELSALRSEKRNLRKEEMTELKEISITQIGE